MAILRRPRSKLAARSLLIKTAVSVTFFLAWLITINRNPIADVKVSDAGARIINQSQKQLQVRASGDDGDVIGDGNGGSDGIKQPHHQKQTQKAAEIPKKERKEDLQSVQKNHGKAEKRYIQTKDGKTLPSALNILNLPPPFDDDKDVEYLVVGRKDLVKSPNTVVTGYFKINSKHSGSFYDAWMKNMLSMKDAMVVFTSRDFVEQIKSLRQHAAEKTAIVVMDLHDLPVSNVYSEEFWEDQLGRDPERRHHKSYHVFWIWLSKSWLVSQAMRLNLFESDIFLWSDIGCFRKGPFVNRTIVEHREMVPRHEVLAMAHTAPNPPLEQFWNDKYSQQEHFYQSGSQLVAYADTWETYEEKFLETVDGFLERGMIIVEDQAILQSACVRYPSLCAYAPSDQVRDNPYFGLRYVLAIGHKGAKNRDKYEYWRHPKSKYHVNNTAEGVALN